MKVSVTPELKDFFSKYGDKSFKNSENIDVDTLYKAYSKIVKDYNSINKENENDGKNFDAIPSLQELLLNSKKEIDLDQNQRTLAQKNLSIMEILRKRSEERKYQSSIKNLSQAKYTKISNNVPDAFGVHYSRDVLMSMNALIGLILTFIGGFYAPLYMGLEDINSRIFIGIGCSILCLIAEVGLFMIYDIKRNIKVSKFMKEDLVYKYLNSKEISKTANIYKPITTNNKSNGSKQTSKNKASTKSKKGKKHKTD
ncbi:endoplasmic reticulum-based factor for assembly of V-ATPase [Cryptosporidium sp. chipmunk genotype I]|uniref:endoplasmic reticulum-based factor for assembly of V-ATPase n=1 Tax=Cryptosporidium sp. chipmunk genotype I TaxID=1280935 RepID=UPI00351A63C0|nr:endoplasmic reticulum-based factor for assembly of V-ATPase [Cryptosporidium sp. chipmunk genotype I]